MFRRVAIMATGTIGGVLAIVAYHPPQLHAVVAVGQAGGKSVTATAVNFVGNVSDTPFGPVQVQISVATGSIVKVSALKLPNGDQRTRSIAQQAVPFLIQQTLGAKSANVLGVTGASYTSEGWRKSLASAMLKAGL